MRINRDPLAARFFIFARPRRPALQQIGAKTAEPNVGGRDRAVPLGRRGGPTIAQYPSGERKTKGRALCLAPCVTWAGGGGGDQSGEPANEGRDCSKRNSAPSRGLAGPARWLARAALLAGELFTFRALVWGREDHDDDHGDGLASGDGPRRPKTSDRNGADHDFRRPSRGSAGRWRTKHESTCLAGATGDARQRLPARSGGL